MHILYLDPYHTGSHAATATSYCAVSNHTVTLLTLPFDGGWRWRMRGAAVTFARLIREQQHTWFTPPDIIFTTDMLDVATFRGVTHAYLPATLPIVVYFFENQITYPLPAGRKRDLSYAWVNYTTALAAEYVLFNSAFHQQWFLDALPSLLSRYHDYHELQMIDTIAQRSQVLPTGINLQRLELPTAANNSVDQAHSPTHANDTPVIAWLNRWEYDKQPEVFFAALEVLETMGIAFRLIVAGEAVDPAMPAFVAAYERWHHVALHWGCPPDDATYRALLHRADIVVSCAVQETLGIGILEALYCHCIPVLPRRLVYPELLPVEYHADCFYQRDEDMGMQLAHVIAERERLAALPWRAIAAPYDWRTLAPRYDALLEMMVQKHYETATKNTST